MLVGRYCDFLDTTPAGLFDDLAAYALSSDCSPSQRRKIAQAMLHITATAELAMAEAQPKLDEPAEVVRELHRTYRLFPALRKLVDSGAMSMAEVMDGIDPPPFAAPE